MFLQELTSQTKEDIGHDDRWLAVQEIVDSLPFKKSVRLSNLLHYLSEQTLRERREMLTEHQIAANVFGRGNFDPSIDTIVRSHMVRLRQKLEQYAEENRPTSNIRVTIPKGEYLVRFEKELATFPVPTQAQPLNEILTVDANIPYKPTRAFIYLCCAFALTTTILAIALFVVTHRSLTRSANYGTTSPNPLWSNLFHSGTTTTFVAADSGLVLLNRLTSKEPSLAEYLNRDFSLELAGLPVERAAEILNLANRRYTSVVDLNLSRHLGQISSTYSGQLNVRYARDIQINDLKQHDVILSGARGSNPWLTLYESNMNFFVARDPVRHMPTFVNRHPQNDEAAEYVVAGVDANRHVLGLLAFLPNLDGNGNALIIEGIGSMAGTEAISDLLFSDETILPFLKKISKPDGRLPHFELLIGSDSINGSAGPFGIVAYRVYP
jgi:hypothetical protein